MMRLLMFLVVLFFTDSTDSDQTRFFCDDDDDDECLLCINWNSSRDERHIIVYYCSTSPDINKPLASQNLQIHSPLVFESVMQSYIIYFSLLGAVFSSSQHSIL